MRLGFAWTRPNFAPSLPSPQRACRLELIRIDSNQKAVFRDYAVAGGTVASGERFHLGSAFSKRLRQTGGRASMACRLSSSGRLRALVAAIRSSPIIVRL